VIFLVMKTSTSFNYLIFTLIYKMSNVMYFCLENVLKLRLFERVYIVKMLCFVKLLEVPHGNIRFLTNFNQTSNILFLF